MFSLIFWGLETVVLTETKESKARKIRICSVHSWDTVVNKTFRATSILATHSWLCHATAWIKSRASWNPSSGLSGHVHPGEWWWFFFHDKMTTRSLLHLLMGKSREEWSHPYSTPWGQFSRFQTSLRAYIWRQDKQNEKAEWRLVLSPWDQLRSVLVFISKAGTTFVEQLTRLCVPGQHVEEVLLTLQDSLS